mmetsp:Transcript_58886/g.128965  ORF Transcript_58886/g.128965 Transcript_58886/m.128965 type:complete len:227 (+) Transcript_58886:867-1547(+)
MLEGLRWRQQHDVLRALLIFLCRQLCKAAVGLHLLLRSFSHHLVGSDKFESKVSLLAHMLAAKNAGENSPPNAGFCQVFTVGTQSLSDGRNVVFLVIGFSFVTLLLMLLFPFLLGFDYPQSQLVSLRCQLLPELIDIADVQSLLAACTSYWTCISSFWFGGFAFIGVLCILLFFLFLVLLFPFFLVFLFVFDLFSLFLVLVLCDSFRLLGSNHLFGCFIWPTCVST